MSSGLLADTRSKIESAVVFVEITSLLFLLAIVAGPVLLLRGEVQGRVNVLCVVASALFWTIMLSMVAVSL